MIEMVIFNHRVNCMQDYLLLGSIFCILYFIFWLQTVKNTYTKLLFQFVPPLLLCYFLPSLLNHPLGLFDGETSKIPSIGSQLCLPACLILFCLNLNLKDVISLGPKLLFIFFTATLGVIIGGPIALAIFQYIFSDYAQLSMHELWRGLSTISGSWIGGSVNQTAMKQIYQPSEELFAAVLIVDVAVASLWMSLLLFLSNHTKRIDGYFKAKDIQYNNLLKKIKEKKIDLKIPTLLDYFQLLAVTFGVVAISHFLSQKIVFLLKPHSDFLAKYFLDTLTFEFFWLVFFATSIAIILSTTRLKKLENSGSMTIANIFLYFLIATIGLKIDLSNILSYWPLFILGLIWMSIHALLLVIICRIFKVPFFYFATASMANIGGAASAPVVASAFNPSLAPIGVILAILGYAVGNYGAIISAWLMQLVSTVN